MENITYPALLHIQPEPRAESFLVSVDCADALDDLINDPADPTRCAHGSRVIAPDRSIHALRYADDIHHLDRSSDVLSDDQLRAVMSRNRNAVGRTSDSYIANASKLSGHPLFHHTVEHAGQLAVMPRVRQVVGCLAIVLLLLLALVLPGAVLYRFLP
jgi:hypothetical protein